MKDFRIVGKNVVEFKRGGMYNLNEDNWIEREVVKLHLLQVVLDKQIDNLCNNAEHDGICCNKIIDLAVSVFEKFKPMIEAGYVELPEDYLEPRMFDLYTKREIVGGMGNCSPMEHTEGLPDGWWFEYQDYAHKAFGNVGDVWVSTDDSTIMISIYDFLQKSEGYNPRLQLEIQTFKDSFQIANNFPELVTKEILEVISFLVKRD